MFGMQAAAECSLERAKCISPRGLLLFFPIRVCLQIIHGCHWPVAFNILIKNLRMLFSLAEENQNILYTPQAGM